MPEFEFGDRTAANQFRDDHANHLCSDDDRRKRTVTLVSDAPEQVLDQAAVAAAVSREDHRGTGQLELSESERDRIDFSKSRASIPHARAVKGIATSEGVDDWTAYYDPTLSVDEHQGVMERASRDERGSRMDSEKTADERLAGVEQALGEECERAQDYCEDGDTDACEYLTEGCGFDEEQVEALLDAEEMPGEAYGLKNKLWQQYQVAIAEAKEAAAGINEVHQQYDRDLVDFEELGDRKLTPADIDWNE
ncbi:hypothetical protein [Haloarchaeobius salinus]|uniref:hypothetical protein n=1 Tax=Haloarchaeobius salinus TaxID=1198298 RepID=UPI00210DFA39|nr:hypothetical protein [Haloarchaeobius salinus]